MSRLVFVFFFFWYRNSPNKVSACDANLFFFLSCFLSFSLSFSVMMIGGIGAKRRFNRCSEKSNINLRYLSVGLLTVIVWQLQWQFQIKPANEWTLAYFKNTILSFQSVAYIPHSSFLVPCLSIKFIVFVQSNWSEQINTKKKSENGGKKNETQSRQWWNNIIQSRNQID